LSGLFGICTFFPTIEKMKKNEKYKMKKENEK
jgi:hypothetical protein